MWVLIIMAVYGYPTDRVDMQEFYSLTSCEAAKEWVISEKANKVHDVDQSKLWSISCVRK